MNDVCAPMAGGRECADKCAPGNENADGLTWFAIYGLSR